MVGYHVTQHYHRTTYHIHGTSVVGGNDVRSSYVKKVNLRNTTSLNSLAMVYNKY